MKKRTLITSLLVIFTILSVNMKAQTAVNPTEEAVKNLKAYPETVDSLVRHVIYLNKHEDESLFKIELIAGRNMEVDCNNHRLIGSFKEEVVDGWGFTYFQFESEGKVISTMMACSQPKEMRFVSGESELTRYNSRLPLVVYLPKDMTLKYKIWSAGSEHLAEIK